jgi:predicted dehydrogenase
VGTERMLVEFGKAGWIDKARQQPDKVRMVLDKIKTDGLMPTVESVFNKLDQPLQLGYCNVGRVIEPSAGFAQGDRVASNGKHAELVVVPANLCARIPGAVSDDEAAFTVIGAIALQGIRLVAPTLGETIVVTGLGLVGLMAVQLLQAHGCRVLGVDFDRSKLELARAFGAETVDLSAGEDPVAAALRFSRGRGVDGVVIAASTKSNDPVHQAALMCRKRGRIVLVGVVGLELSRADFYEKELTFQVSCSYGPGRYDPVYEEKGQDYPVGFVRWTEQRNFEAVLDMMASKRVDVRPLISHRFAVEEAAKAYDLISSDAPSLGVLLEYPEGEAALAAAETKAVELPPSSSTSAQISAASISVIGSGNYATAVLIPAFKEAGARLRSVASAKGVSGVHAGRKFGFETTTTDVETIFTDAQAHAVVVTTRHDSHANLVLRALAAGKHVFVEKPLCLTLDELAEIEAAQAKAGKSVMVGFNRRFAPHVKKMKELVAASGSPKALVMTVNAGAIPADHWTQDTAVGGGRILGEVCHFVDLLRFVAGAPITGWRRTTMDAPTDDTVSVELTFADGSIGTIHYFANGSKAFPKERLEVFSNGRILQLDNFRKLTGFGWPSFRGMSLWRQDKGQRACARAFVQALESGGPPPIPFSEILEVSRVVIELART